MPKPKRRLKAIPAFKTEAEEGAFWRNADSTEYVDRSKARRVTFPKLRRSTTAISIRLPDTLLSELKQMANERDVPYQSLLKVYLSERVVAERRREWPRPVHKEATHHALMRARLVLSYTSRMPGRIEALWLKRAHRGPMDAVQAADFIVDEGLAGSVGRSKRRQVTLIEREVWHAHTTTLGRDIDPGSRRANVMLSGISLPNTRGRVLRIGTAVRLAIGGETTPCERMEEALPGLQEIMRDNWGGGAFAQVITGGTVRIGDAVEWEVEDR